VRLFLAIDVLLHPQNHTSGRTTSKGADHPPERLTKQIAALQGALQRLQGSVQGEAGSFGGNSILSAGGGDLLAGSMRIVNRNKRLFGLKI